MPKIVHCGLDYSGGGGGSGEANFIELSQSEYDELTYEEKHDPNKMYMITDGPQVDAQYFDPVIYSLEEREIGVWTDGKPLYEKTYTWSGSLSNNNYVVLDADIKPTNYLVHNQTLMFKISGANNRFISNALSNSYTLCIASNEGDGLYAENRTGQIITDIVTTVRYTKTTDIPGSGSYAELGVPAVHYSADEQIIGTWFGDTLYQKTLYDAGGRSSSFSINHGITNLKAVVGYSGCVTDVTFPLPLPRISYDGNNVGVQSANTTQIGICNPSAFETRLIDWYITLQYTKTTS